MILEDGSSTIEESKGHHPQREEVSSRVKGVGEGILWGQVVQGGLADGLAVGVILFEGPERLWMEIQTKNNTNKDRGVWVNM